MSKIYFNLNEALEKLNITPNKLAVQSRTHPPTIYKMVENKATRIHLQTIQRIIDTLNEMADEKKLDISFDINDMIKYVK